MTKPKIRSIQLELVDDSDIQMHIESAQAALGRIGTTPDGNRRTGGYDVLDAAQQLALAIMHLDALRDCLKAEAHRQAHAAEKYHASVKLTRVMALQEIDNEYAEHMETMRSAFLKLKHLGE